MTNEDLQFRYESGASVSYLVIRTNLLKEILAYQVEMVAGNRILNFIPFNIKHKDENMDIYYDITSKLSLSQYLKKKKLKKNEFIRIIQNIVNTLIECKGYLLYDKSFILKEEYIYIDPETSQIFLIYIPMSINTDTCIELKSLILRLITESADIIESSNDNFLQKIIGFLKGEDFKIQDIKKLLQDLNCEDVKDTSNVELNIINKVEFPPEIKGTVQSRQKSEKRLNKSKAGIKNLLPAIILVQILIIIFLVIGYDFFKSLSSDVLTTYGAVIFVIAAAEGLVIKKVADKNREKTKDDQTDKNKLPDRSGLSKEFSPWSMTEELNKSFKKQYGGIKDLFDKDQIPIVEQKFIKKLEESSNAFQATNNETVLLYKNKEEYPYLKSTLPGNNQVIQIIKSNLVVGRLKEQVDCIVENNSVGKVHAEIIINQDKYYIKDFNSRNGTYVNNNKIDSNINYEIKNNDKVSIANSDYVFIIP